MARDDLVFEAGDARVVLSPALGGRLASVVVAGRELLVNEGETHPMQWGSYPMVPWAGRIRHGRFTFRGREVTLPLGMPPHAIHGVAYDRPWEVVDGATIAIDLARDERWPFGGRVTQRLAMDGDGLEITMTLEASRAMPAMLGWHPWFRRVPAPGDAPARLVFAADVMLARDEEGIPDGRRVPPSPGPGTTRSPAARGPGDRVAEPPAPDHLLDLRLVDRVLAARARRVRGAAERSARAFNGEPEVLEAVVDDPPDALALDAPRSVAGHQVRRQQVARSPRRAAARPGQVDAGQRALAHRTASAPSSSPSSFAEVRVVAHEAAVGRRRGAQDVRDAARSRGPPAVVHRPRGPPRRGHDLRRLRRPDPGRGDEQVGRLAGRGQQPAQPLRLASALVGQRAERVVARPARGSPAWACAAGAG